jgi:pimeloyl-ACP methyl ester carboxylesterase
VSKVTSRDGTSIDIERTGEGPPVVLVTGGSVDRASNTGLAAEISKSFSVFNYDRRGRGDSTDTPPYAIEREIEDIEAVIAEAGGSAHLYGSSSGAALALLAAASGLPLMKVALWEPPFVLDESRRPPTDQVERYKEMIAGGRRGDAVEYFMVKVIGMPPEMVGGMRD